MTTYVAFLRAINLGATRKFPKDAIVRTTESAGFTGVATHINTGNVRLQTAMRSRARIEAALERAYRSDRGFEVPTMVFTCAELTAVGVQADRIARDHGTHHGFNHGANHYVSLLKDEPDPAAAAELEKRSSGAARVVVAGRAVHLLLSESYGESLVSNVAVERVLGVATNRRLTVIRALVEKWC